MTLAIVHVISGPMAGGAEIFVKDLAIAQAASGQRPVIGLISRARDLGRSAEFERAYLADLETARIPYFFIGHQCRRNLLLGAWRVRRHCRAHSAQIYHSHLKYALVSGALLRIPHVHTHHNSVAGASRWMYRRFNSLVDAYVGISDLCADLLASFTGRRVTTIRNSINLQKFGLRPHPRRLSSERIECIAVGNISVQKSYPTLVEAVRLLPPALRGSVHLSLVGDGDAAQTAALRATIAAAGLDDTITLLGARSDVPQLLANAQLFVMSSAWEGMPIALLEATAAGLPFIATDVGGCAELAQLCGNEIIVPPNDPADLANAIADISASPERFRTLSQNALDNSALIGIECAVEQHLALYRSLLTRKKKR